MAGGIHAILNGTEWSEEREIASAPLVPRNDGGVQDDRRLRMLEVGGDCFVADAPRNDRWGGDECH